MSAHVKRVMVLTFGGRVVQQEQAMPEIPCQSDAESPL